MADGFGEIASVALANSRMLDKLEENEKELKIHSEHLEGSLSRSERSSLKIRERMATIGQTAGMVGHDIRNPLQAISGDVFLVNAELASIPEKRREKKCVNKVCKRLKRTLITLTRL